jgi:hypothetical protein
MDADVGLGGEHTLGLLDEDPAVQAGLEMRVDGPVWRSARSCSSPMIAASART